MVINPRVEMMPTEEKVELILQRFRKNLRWALEKSSFYKKKYNGLDIHAEDIKTLSDIICTSGNAVQFPGGNLFSSG